jgi:K+-sensing histidine kinase KdpD
MGGSPEVLHRRTPREDDHGVTVPIPRWLRATLASAALVAAVAAVIALLEPRVPALGLGLGVLYLLPVVPIALAYGSAVAGAVSVASVAAFSYLFLPPRYGKAVSPPTPRHDR